MGKSRFDCLRDEEDPSPLDVELDQDDTVGKRIGSSRIHRKRKEVSKNFEELIIFRAKETKRTDANHIVRKPKKVVSQRAPHTSGVGPSDARPFMPLSIDKPTKLIRGKGSVQSQSSSDHLLGPTQFVHVHGNVEESPQGLLREEVMVIGSEGVSLEPNPDPDPGPGPGTGTDEMRTDSLLNPPGLV